MQLPDGKRLINVFAGTFSLAGMMADATADAGEGMFLFEELESLVIPAVIDQRDIALDADMRRTGGLAGRRASLVDAVGTGNCLGILFKSGSTEVKLFVVFVREGNGADLCALTTACAF